MKIYIDFDDTIAQSLPVVVNIVNKRYGRNANVQDIGRWNFSDVYPDISAHNIVKVFGEDEFFKHLKIKAGMNPNYWNNRIKVYRFRTVEIGNEN